ncbi:MAG: ABC transporter permease [Lachnospiraceae bacterium]|nr:ABC transporter permease [Lachnospiraceae bacterium]
MNLSTQTASEMPLSSVSSEQTAFLEKHKKYHLCIAFSRWSILVIFLLLWELATQLSWIDGFFFSSPSRIVLCLIRLLRQNELLTHCSITLAETFLSFLLVTVLSVLSSIIFWYSQKTAEIVEPFLVVLNSLPKSALAPLFIVWLGTGMKTIIVAGISVALFGSIISIYNGFKQIDAEEVTLIYTLHGTKLDVLQKVIIPGSIPTLLSTMKVNIGLALVGVVIGEFLSAKRGLGYLIIYGSQVFQLDLVITSIIILCLIAMGLYLCIQYMEHFYKKHH